MPMRSLRIEVNRAFVEKFASKNGDCCAGCAWWRFVNSVSGECIKSAPMPEEDRIVALGIDSMSLKIGGGHAITRRDHFCGDFKGND